MRIQQYMCTKPYVHHHHPCTCRRVGARASASVRWMTGAATCVPAAVGWSARGGGSSTTDIGARGRGRKRGRGRGRVPGLWVQGALFCCTCRGEDM